MQIGGDSIAIYQSGNKRDMQTGTIEAARKSIQSLQNFLESGDNSDKVYSGKQRERQDCKAVEWASKNNIQIIEENQFLDKWAKSGKIRGGEASTLKRILRA